ncbi:hypothetical protein PAESOLCIP111_01240 [Paenibacillus solanacearum]|uniref:Uncharacterized protein n=1 Tax=Paenibacillus solanacearum TaxID=2048548 RepID=A0A916JZH0_9BACL|nr:hypothetical protein PAESOLCIP111_01240 [Paenibacillus solanacearum]
MKVLFQCTKGLSQARKRIHDLLRITKAPIVNNSKTN